MHKLIVLGVDPIIINESADISQVGTCLLLTPPRMHNTIFIIFPQILGEHILLYWKCRNVVLGRIVFQTHEFLLGRVGEQSPSWRPAIPETFWSISGAEVSDFVADCLGSPFLLICFFFLRTAWTHPPEACLARGPDSTRISPHRQEDR